MKEKLGQIFSDERAKILVPTVAAAAIVIAAVLIWAACVSAKGRAEGAAEEPSRAEEAAEPETDALWAEQLIERDVTAEAETQAEEALPAEAETETESETKEPGTPVTYTFTDIDNRTMYATRALNVRALPTINSALIGELAWGESVTVTGKCNETNWYRFTYSGRIGYAAGSYLSTAKPTAKAASTGSKSTVTFATAKSTGATSVSANISSSELTQFTKNKGYLVTRTVTKSEFYQLVQKFMKNSYVTGLAYFMPTGSSSGRDYSFVWDSGRRWDCSAMTLYFINDYLLPYDQAYAAAQKKTPSASAQALLSTALGAVGQPAAYPLTEYSNSLAPNNAKGQASLLGNPVYTYKTLSWVSDADPGNLQYGDLLFYGYMDQSGTPYHISHVTMYLGQYYLSSGDTGYYMMENLPHTTDGFKEGRKDGVRIGRFTKDKTWDGDTMTLIHTTRLFPVEETKKETEKSSEKSSEKSTEKSTEKSSEKSNEKSTEESTESSSEKSSEKTTESASESLTEESTESSSEETSEKSGEKTAEKTPETGS